jgi:hypothetical protein
MFKPKASKTKSILFTDVIGIAKEYAPKPAIHFIPQWYKKMEPRFPKEKKPESLASIKKCIPVLDSMTAGYIIVSPCDVYVSTKDGEPHYNSVINNVIDFHPRKQAHLHPSANDFMFPKWKNPWAIKTPQGYSCLFKPPAHNPNPWFEILEGIVDTDTYTAGVNFPFVLKNPTAEFMIPAGTPIAQVIPFKRDEWKLSLSEDKESPRGVINYLNSQFFDRYKRMFWNRKSYT